MSYSNYIESDADKAILEQDMITFTASFANLLDINNFEHCTIIHHLQTICAWHRVDYPEIMLAFKNNHIFMLYLSIKKDRTLLYEDWKEAECERKQAIYELCERTTNEEFNSLWTALEGYNLEQHDRWEVSTGIGLLFESLATNPDRFLTSVNSYILHGTPFGTQYAFIPSKLIELLGYDDALEFVGTNEFDDKKQWLAHIYNSIPDNKIDEETQVYFIKKLDEQKDDDAIYTLSLSTVLRIDSLYPGFLVRYTEVMNEICEKRTWVISAFINVIDMRDFITNSQFVNRFKDRLDVLKNAYLNALRGRQYFDYQGHLLMQIIKRDIGYISAVVNNILADRYYHGNAINLNALWDQDNYEELVAVAMDTIKEKSKPFYGFNSLGESLFTCEQGKTERWARKERWISDYIIRNNTDADSMEFIFEIVCNMSDEQRKASVLLFCKYNCSYSDFRRIPLMPNHMSWSGSQVPILEKRISFLEDLKNALPGFVYIEHRAYLAERIQCILEEKERVLLQEFIEAR